MGLMVFLNLQAILVSMVLSSSPSKSPSKKLCNFLQERFGLSDNDINLGIRHSENEHAPLPIILWTFGIINLSQLKLTFNWLKQHE
tara:strand:- start:203 stop:460 length:258 start_codon:yes stop_codon:yes gene_type:complete